MKERLMVKCSKSCPGKQDKKLKCEVCEQYFHGSCDPKIERSSVCSGCELYIAQEGHMGKRSVAYHIRLLNLKDKRFREAIMAQPRAKNVVHYKGMDNEGERDKDWKSYKPGVKQGEGITQTVFLTLPTITDADYEQYSERADCMAQFPAIIPNEPPDFIWARWNAYHANLAHFQKRVEEVLGVISGNVSQDIRKFITSAYADELEMEYLKIEEVYYVEWC